MPLIQMDNEIGFNSETINNMHTNCPVICTQTNLNSDKYSEAYLIQLLQKEPFRMTSATLKLTNTNNNSKPMRKVTKKRSTATIKTPKAIKKTVRFSGRLPIRKSNRNQSSDPSSNIITGEVLNTEKQNAVITKPLGYFNKVVSSVTSIAGYFCRPLIYGIHLSKAETICSRCGTAYSNCEVPSSTSSSWLSSWTRENVHRDQKTDVPVSHSTLSFPSSSSSSSSPKAAVSLDHNPEQTETLLNEPTANQSNGTLTLPREQETDAWSNKLHKRSRLTELLGAASRSRSPLDENDDDDSLQSYRLNVASEMGRLSRVALSNVTSNSWLRKRKPN